MLQINISFKCVCHALSNFLFMSVKVRWCEVLLYAIFQPYLVIYGGPLPQLEWTSNLPLATDNYLSWDSNPSGEGRVVSKREALTTRPRRPPYVCLEQTEITQFQVNSTKHNNIWCKIISNSLNIIYITCNIIKIYMKTSHHKKNPD